MYQLLDEWTVAGAAGVAGVVQEPGVGYSIDLEAYNPFTHRIIGCAMRVHAILGSGFPEIIYQRALAIELEREQVTAQREIETPVYFRGQQIGSRRVDFLVESPVPNHPILVELKVATDFTDAHFAQIINYLEAFRLPVGLLLNFGGLSLQYRRFVKTSFAT